MLTIISVVFILLVLVPCSTLILLSYTVCPLIILLINIGTLSSAVWSIIAVAFWCLSLIVVLSGLSLIVFLKITSVIISISSFIPSLCVMMCCLMIICTGTLIIWCYCFRLSSCGSLWLVVLSLFSWSYNPSISISVLVVWSFLVIGWLDILSPCFLIIRGCVMRGFRSIFLFLLLIFWRLIMLWFFSHYLKTNSLIVVYD